MVGKKIRATLRLHTEVQLRGLGHLRYTESRSAYFLKTLKGYFLSERAHQIGLSAGKQQEGQNGQSICPFAAASASSISRGDLPDWCR